VTTYLPLTMFVMEYIIGLLIAYMIIRWVSSETRSLLYCGAVYGITIDIWIVSSVIFTQIPSNPNRITTLSQLWIYSLPWMTIIGFMTIDLLRIRYPKRNEILSNLMVLAFGLIIGWLVVPPSMLGAVLASILIILLLYKIIKTTLISKNKSRNSDKNS
jgi:hypothetical protein